jgi:hypothetical protein
MQKRKYVMRNRKNRCKTGARLDNPPENGAILAVNDIFFKDRTPFERILGRRIKGFADGLRATSFTTCDKKIC